jgi:hypothetical protein
MALCATQAHRANEFNFHPHGCPRDNPGNVSRLLWSDVDSPLGMSGDSASKASKTNLMLVDERTLDKAAFLNL